MVAGIILLNLDRVLITLGATPEILPTARTYATIFMIGNPFCVVGCVGYYFTRVAERPLAASISFIVPCIIAVCMEYYIIFHTNAGIMGSALSWII